MKTTRNLALHYGADGVTKAVTDPAEFRKLYRSGKASKMVFGADENDATYQTGGTSDVAYHPGRDYQWGAIKNAARGEWAGLAAAGLPLKSKLFMGEDADVSNDLDLLWSIAGGEHKRKGKDAAWLFDAAPNLYIAQETIHRTGEMIEEDFIQMSAKTLLPDINYNTWLDAYRFDRKARKLNGVAMPVSLGGITERGVRKAGSHERKPEYRALEFFESGASWEWYELERHAEARRNGAPGIDIIRDELADARLMHELTYNFSAFFGFPQTGVEGLIPQLVTEGRSVGAAQQLGANTNPEEDLAIFVNNWTEMLISSINVEKPDTIALGNAAWIYINTTDYKTVDAGMNETLAQAIMRKLGPLGLKDLIFVPEMDYQSEQALSWQNEINLPQALAEAWAGGLNQENIMLMFAKDVNAGRMVVGKPMASRPQLVTGERTTVLMIQSLGSYEIRRPIAHRLVTDIGPV